MFFGDGDATKVDVTTVGSVLEVVGNLIFIINSIQFLYWRAYYAAAISIPVALISPMYHMCKAQWYCFSMGENVLFAGSLLAHALERLRLLDHLSSNNAVGGTVLIAAFSDGGGGKHVIVYRILVFFVTAYGVLSFPYQMSATFVLVSYLVLVVAFEYVVMRGGRLPPADRFYVSLGVIGLVTVAVGLFLYYSTSFIPPEISHALWHPVIGIAENLIVRAVNHRRLQNVSV